MVDFSKVSKSYNEIFSNLRKKGIFINLHYLPIHLHPYYRKFGFKNGDYPVAEKYSKSAISLPIYPTLKLFDQKKIVSILKKILY